MTKTGVSRPSNLWDVNPQPLFVQLLPERLEMPGLSLTLAQATRLLGVSPEACRRILGVLIHEGSVRLRRDGCYVYAAGASSRAASA